MRLEESLAEHRIIMVGGESSPVERAMAEHIAEDRTAYEGCGEGICGEMYSFYGIGD